MKTQFLSACCCLGVAWILLAPLNACNRVKKSSEHKEIHKKHDVEIQKSGIGMIYLDRVPNYMILKSEGKDSGNFISIRVGFQENHLLTDRKKSAEEGKYFQYNIEKDWVTIIHGDSVRPVFYQPLEQRSQQIHEGILVFEAPGGIFPDTLFYKDSPELWGKQLVIFQ